jgi:hypothetical protein
MKNRLLGVELFRADGRTDMKQPTDAFLNFASATKNRMPLPRFLPRTAQHTAYSLQKHKMHEILIR